MIIYKRYAIFEMDHKDLSEPYKVPSAPDIRGNVTISRYKKM